MHISIESDADLLAACRTRQAIIDALDDQTGWLEHYSSQLVIAAFFTDSLLSEPERQKLRAELEHTQARFAELTTSLNEWNSAIAAAVAHALLNPMPVGPVPIARVGQARPTAPLPFQLPLNIPEVHP